MWGAVVKKKNILIVALLVMNGVLLYLLYFPERKTLADVAAQHSGSKDYVGFYRSLGSYFNRDMMYLPGDKISILYEPSEGLLYLYDADGPVLGYASNSVEIYPPDFDGSFHDRAPGMVYYERDLSVLSYYDGSRLKIGHLSNYPELVLDTRDNKTDVGLPSFLEAGSGNRVESIFKSGKECRFIEPDVTYFACCSVEQESSNVSALAEGYVYWPFNKPRWFKIKKNARLDQALFDSVCNEIYKDDIFPDRALRKKLGEHFMNLDLEGVKKELRRTEKSLGE